MRSQDLSPEAALKWGQAFSADVIIAGKSGMSGSIVNVDLEAIRVEDGKSISHAVRSETINPADSGEDRFINAIGAAVENIAVRICPEIIKAVNKRLVESNQIQITLEGINSFEEVRSFKRFLEEEISDVKSVVQSRVKGGSITLSVEYPGKKETFIDRLRTNEKMPFRAAIAVSDQGDIVVHVDHEIIEPAAREDILQQD
jgi:hypothetical protein